MVKKVLKTIHTKKRMVVFDNLMLKSYIIIVVKKKECTKNNNYFVYLIYILISIVTINRDGVRVDYFENHVVGKFMIEKGETWLCILLIIELFSTV